MKPRLAFLLVPALCMAGLAVARPAWGLGTERSAAPRAIVVPLAPLPKLTGRVVDLAHLLPAPVAQRLTVRLASFEARTKHQLVIVTIPSLNGEPIEKFGLRLGNGWGVGRRRHNDGVLLIVAPSERRVRIEVGYGLEKTLTDQASARIIAQDLVPAFRKGDFPGGIERGANAIMAQLSR
jgi:uncharacterized protein